MTSPPPALCRAPRHPGALARPRLVAALDGGAPVAVLSAPAGWGKTVLAAQLGAGTGTAMAWARCAPGWDTDEDVVALWATSLAAPTDLDDPAGALLAMAEAEPTTFVVDDAHLGDAESLDRLVAEVAPLLPPGTRIVVAGRTRPAGLLGRLGSLAVVVGGALAFTPDEAAALATDLGGDPGAARRRAEQVGGWPAAVAAAATPGAGHEAELGPLLLGAVGASGRPVLAALTALPWVDAALADRLGWGAEARTLVATSGLVADLDGRWSLDVSLAEQVAPHLAADELAAVRGAAVDHLRSVDPLAAIEVLLDAGRPEEAADVLADNLSVVGVEHAVAWLYRLPAALRHRFPPVLAAGRATVALDLAEAEAQRRVDEAIDEPTRREALLSLGSARSGAGRLSAAAEALESAVVGDPTGAVARRAWPLLALVRARAGDRAGAAAAVEQVEPGARPEVAAEVALLAGDDAGAVAALAAAEGGRADVRDGLRAQAAVLAGEPERARSLAEGAYRSAVATAGDELVPAATAWAWVLVGDGAHDEALAVADVLERRVGRHDAHARLQGALVRLAVARAGGPGDPEREARRVAQLRQAGYAPVEALARRALPSLGGGPAVEACLVVEVLGAGRVLVDGRPLSEGAWRSRKALEVLRVLALAGRDGLTREALVEAVWPGREPASARTVLRRALSDVRKELEPHRPTGEASRFVGSGGDRVVVDGATDLAAAEAALASAPGEAFDLLAPGPAADLGDAEWAEELRRRVAALRLQAAEAVASGGDATRRRGALERLVADEPWSREHVDALAALHREAGDEAAARAVERAWFADDG